MKEYILAIKENEIIKSMQDNQLKALIEKVLIDKSTIEKTDDGLAVCEWIIHYLDTEKMITPYNRPMFLDVLLTAAMLHNIMFDRDKDKWYKLFETREHISKYAIDLNIPSSTMEAVYQAIECQLNKDIPQRLLYPTPNSPTAHFALACSTYYNKIKKEYSKVVN